MNELPIPSLYNPRAQTDDDRFIAEFVARHTLLKTLLRRLRSADFDGMGLHHILIGPRGMGKTSLLRRIAIAINREPDLSAHFIPLNFREEQYNVLTIGDFWRNCGESLAEWAEATGQSNLAQRLDDALPTDAWTADENAADQFSAEMAALGRRAILLVDNLDLILDALPKEGNWAMRRRLQARRGPIIIGASTHALKQSADREAPFYEFFQPDYLEPLDAQETEQCMRALARSGGEHGTHVIRSLDSQPERLRTLHTLTGGNPRVLALIYRLLGTDESKAAMADLEHLLDQVTPYYKAKVEEYQTAQQRAVIDAIALHWDPITTGNLASLTRIPATTLSPLLIRLRKDGLIESVEVSGAYAGHQLTERFLNIWYLMRHGTRRTKQKMRWLVAFLTSFYSLSELTEIAGRAPDRENWHREYQFALHEALERQAMRLEVHEIRGQIDDRGLRERNQQTSRLSVGRAASQVSSHLNAPDQAVKALISEAVNHARAGNNAAELAVYDDVLARLADAPESDLRGMVAKVLFNKAITFSRMGDNVAELAAYDDVLVRFIDSQELGLRELVANVLLNKAVTIGQMGDSAGEIAIYDDILTRFIDAPEFGLREQVAMVLVNKAVTLSQMGDSIAAISTFDDVLVRFADAPEGGLREQVAKALFNRAIILGQTGDKVAELASYNEVLTRFLNAQEPGLREQVAKTLINKAITFGQIGDSAAAIATFDDVLARFVDAPEPSLSEQVARAQVNKAMILGQMGNNAAAIAIYDEVLARLADASEPSLREQVALALFNKSITFSQMGNSAAAVATYDEVLAHLADASEPGLRELAAKALFNKALTLGQIGDSAAEIAIYDDVLIRFADAPEASLREVVATALVNKAATLNQTGNSTAAIATYDDILTRFIDAPEPGLRELVAKVLVNKAATLSQMGNSTEAISICDDVLARFIDAPEPGLRAQVAKALFNKAIAFGQIGDSAAAIATYDDVLARFIDAPEPSLREQVAKTICAKAITLREEGEITAAIDALQQLLDHSSNELQNSPTFNLGIARITLANMLLDMQGDQTRPEVLYREAIQNEPVSAKANLAWLYLLTDRSSDAHRELQELNNLPPVGLALLNAGVDLASNNFGSATRHLAIALDSDLNVAEMSFSDDLERLLRLAQHKGFGEHLVAWLEQTGLADRLAPLYVAFKAYVRTDKLLLDANPEVRSPAKAIYDRLDAPRRHRAASAPKRQIRRRSRHANLRDR